jgi:DNA-binding NarL/FixJ family response regulator
MVCRLQDDGSCPTTGYHLSMVLMARAIVAIAQGELEQGERDAHDALACAADAEAYLKRMGAVRFKISYGVRRASVAGLRDALGERNFESAWAEGAALSTENAINYAQRGRGERKCPASGWESLTPTERDVIRLVSEGLGNKDIATRLFVSPRTVQTHLTHVYT